MGAEMPKQFLEIGGLPIILHTLNKFKQALPMAELVLVLPEAEIFRWETIAHKTIFQNITVALGGSTRFHSVKSALAHIKELDSIVAVHDAVRPFVSAQTILRSMQKAAKENCAIPVVELKDSIRQLSGDNSTSVDRTNYRLVQTPQCFKAKILLDAYKQNYSKKFTDDASVVEALGHKISLVAGNTENQKITTKEDLIFAESLLKIN
jgi:2-C-methyl-D-erythritol 4-phosphate cytidylyltransferase